MIGRSITPQRASRDHRRRGAATVPRCVAAEMADVWVPLLTYHRIHGTARRLMDRAFAPMQVIGRLAPGASLTQARVELAHDLRPAANSLPRHQPAPLGRAGGVFDDRWRQQYRGDSRVQIPGRLFHRDRAHARDRLRQCRQPDARARRCFASVSSALRQTLGASRGRILNTLVAEGVILAIAAWLAACLFALAVSKGVIHFFPPNEQGATLLLDLTPDWQVIVHAFALAIAGTLVFAVGPAVRAWHQELLPSLRSGELGVVAGRSALSSALVVVQLGFAVLLLTSAGLAYRSLDMLGSIRYRIQERKPRPGERRDIGSGRHEGGAARIARPAERASARGAGDPIGFVCPAGSATTSRLDRRVTTGGHGDRSVGWSRLLCGARDDTPRWPRVLEQRGSPHRSGGAHHTASRRIALAW